MVKPTVVRRKPARDLSLLAKMLGRVCRVIFYRKWQGIGASSLRPLSYLLRSRRLNQWCRSLSYRVTVQVKKTYASSILLKRPASLREACPFCSSRVAAACTGVVLTYGMLFGFNDTPERTKQTNDRLLELIAF